MRLFILTAALLCGVLAAAEVIDRNEFSAGNAAAVPPGFAVLTLATMTSPMLPSLRKEPPITRMHMISFAPELSATFNRVCG